MSRVRGGAPRSITKRGALCTERTDDAHGITIRPKYCTHPGCGWEDAGRVSGLVDKLNCFMAVRGGNEKLGENNWPRRLWSK